MQNRLLDNENERVFEENFVKRQEDIISMASALVTKQGLLEADKIKAIMDYTRDLYANIKDFSISGKVVRERNFLGLIKLIEDTQEALKTSWHLQGIHPLIPAIKTVKMNLIKSLEITQPQYWLTLQNHFLDNDEKKYQIKSTKCASVYEILKDSCGIFACLLWFVPEKVLTLCNGCQPCCGPSAACCPETPLPKHIDNNRTIYWNLWSPRESIGALCNDIETQCHVIQDSDQKLNQVPMSRL